MPTLDQLLVAVSHQSRRAILARLKGGPLRVTEIAAPFHLSLNAVSKHLKVLEAAGLIRRERQGREHRIHLQAELLRQVADWVQGYEAQWNRQLDRLEGHFQSKLGGTHEANAVGSDPDPRTRHRGKRRGGL